MADSDAYRVAIAAIRTALLEVAQDNQIDPRYTLLVIGRILHNLDNVVGLELIEPCPHGNDPKLCAKWPCYVPEIDAAC